MENASRKFSVTFAIIALIVIALAAKPAYRAVRTWRAESLAAEIARGPNIAHCVTKKQLDAEWHVSIEDALEMESEAQARCMQTNDFRRASDAFANKRTPEFRGD